MIITVKVPILHNVCEMVIQRLRNFITIITLSFPNKVILLEGSRLLEKCVFFVS